jgi:hypothetical protein
MFQYAFGKVLEWKYGIKVYYDLLRDEIETPLESYLDVFSIDLIVEMEPKVRKQYEPFSVRQFRDNGEYFKYAYYKLRRKYQTNKLITEPWPSMYLPVTDQLDLDVNHYFLGFWQNHRYFIGYEDRIRKLYVAKDPVFLQSDMVQEIDRSDYDTISLHFRRGDYLTSGFIEPTSMEYYTQAVDMIASKVNNPFFYIFTDEPDWVNENFTIDFPHKLVSGNTGNDAYKDILLMSRCRHHIIANSTFSWWGAWLNANPDKIVTVPKKWYADDERNKFTNEICPVSWIRI